MKLASLAALSLAIALGASLGPRLRAQSQPVIATFDVANEYFRVRIENPDTIEQVRALQRGESTATIPNGKVLRGTDGNAPWRWHLDANDIEMAEVAIELCDGTPSMIEDGLDYWVDTIGRFCPWNAKLIAVDDAQKEPEGVCIDPVGTFDPKQYEGGCINFKRGEDSVLVIGRGLLDNGYLNYGRTVSASANGQTCGYTTIPGVDGTFMLTISGDSLQPGCATAGQQVTFAIYSQPAAETLAWPEEPGSGPVLLSLTSVTHNAWYWFERVSTPRPAVGTRVEAHVGAAVCGEATIGGEDNAIGYFIPDGIRGFSELRVPATLAPPECSQSGALIEFRVNGMRAETAVVWRPGVQRLNLMVQGDANCDFVIDSRDALLALQVEAALITSVPCHGDADRDRDIDVFDALHILEFAAGISNALPL